MKTVDLNDNSFFFLSEKKRSNYEAVASSKREREKQQDGKRLDIRINAQNKLISIDFFVLCVEYCEQNTRDRDDREKKRSHSNKLK